MKNPRQHHNAPRSDRTQSTSVNGRLIMGRNCIAEVLRHNPETLSLLYVADDRTEGAREADPVREIVGLARSQQIEVLTVSRDKLTSLVQSDGHQGVVAISKDRKEGSLKELLSFIGERERACILVLDHIQDPQNLGALLRAAEIFGVDGVVWARSRSAGLTPVAAKASQGASELLLTCEIPNLAEGLEKMKEAGFWVVGADIDAKASSLPGFDWPAKCVLVMGAEGDGLASLTKKKLDFTVSIPQAGKLQSLNVSQATSILLYAWAFASKGK